MASPLDPTPTRDAASPPAGDTPDGNDPYLTTPQSPAARPHFGRYRVERKLGQGGMGSVYLAHDPQLGRDVALKVPEFRGPPSLQTEARQRFVREAHSAAKVRHPHVCPVYDVGEHDGRPFVVMAYVEGSSLADSLKQLGGRFDDPAAAVALVKPVAEALAAVHAAGLVHRDVKPGNILLDAAGVPHLADFGLARSADGSDQMTEPSAVVGTPAFMAPEQFDRTLGPVGPAADVYALGVVLYQMLTGRTPFTGTLTELMFETVHGELPPPSRFRPGLDPGLEAVALKALARRPQDRYASATEFARALADWQTGRAAAATVSQSWKTVRPPARRPNLLALLWPSSSRTPAAVAWRRWSAVAGAVMGVVLLAVLATKGVRRPLGVGPHSERTDAEMRPEAKTPPLPLKAVLDVRVWPKGEDPPGGRRLHEAGVLPLKPGDQFRIEASADRPAYLYLFWIDTEGQAVPVYPWQPGQWGTRPAAERPVTELELPPTAAKGYTISGEQPGMETLILIARTERLALSDEQVQAWFAGLPAQRPFQDAQSAVWFENGRIVTADDNRRKRGFEETDINDPVLRVQGLLKDRIGPNAAATVAVSFARLGKGGMP
jgi:predicted Ser/Thr protein kinase